MRQPIERRGDRAILPIIRAGCVECATVDLSRVGNEHGHHQQDLRTRIEIFAHDSMMGRDAPLEGDRKGADYLARELRRLGLEPAGENGTYFQSVPSLDRMIGRDGVLGVGGDNLRYGVDFIAASRSTPRPIDGAQVVYGGSLDQPEQLITRQQATGKFVIVTVPATGSSWTQPIRYVSSLMTAAGIAVVNLDRMSAAERAAVEAPTAMFVANADMTPAVGPILVNVTAAAADRLFGAPVAGQKPGAPGVRGRVRGQFQMVARPSAPNTARNVIAVLRGSDPRLRGQYVAIGAHKDHVGFTGSPVDHDSLRAVLLADH